MLAATNFNEQMWLAVAEPNRRRLIDILLTEGQSTASRLADKVPFSRQAVMKHIAILKKANLVRAHKAGKEVLLDVDPAGIRVAAHELSLAAALWDQRLQRIKEIAESLAVTTR